MRALARFFEKTVWMGGVGWIALGMGSRWIKGSKRRPNYMQSFSSKTRRQEKREGKLEV